MDGLTNQLLNVVVTTERSDLETQWADLVNEMSADALLLVTLEDTLLRELSSSQVRHHIYFCLILLQLFLSSTIFLNFLSLYCVLFHFTFYIFSYTNVSINWSIYSSSLPSIQYLFPFFQGNILDNLELIATLENTKSTAVEIQEKLFQAIRTKVITDNSVEVIWIVLCCVFYTWSFVAFSDVTRLFGDIW